MKNKFTTSISYNNSYISKVELSVNTYFNTCTHTSPPYYTSTSTIIYVTDGKKPLKCNQIPYNIVDSSNIRELTKEEIEREFAPIFIDAKSIIIPKKVENIIRNHIPKKDLKKINKNRDIAIELCLLFLSNLSSTYYCDNPWKSLSSTYLNDQFRWKNDNTYIYTKIKDLLLRGTQAKGPIIEIKKNEVGNPSFIVGETSIKYRLTPTYLNPGLIKYTLTNDYLIRKRKEFILERIQKSSTNLICRNLFDFYKKVTLPTKEEIWIEASKLLSKNYITKKGKKLTLRNKHSNKHWKYPEKRSFVEDNIELFEYLTERGFMIPQPGSEASGGRVVDSFTLMPSWIRNLCKINSKPIVEVDFSTLHPNIAMMLYSGSGRNINHTDVANYLGIPRSEAKIEHLSFFNKTWDGVINSPVFDYYFNNEPDMLQKLYDDKIKNGYKITSKRLFKAEVQIMTQVIKELNQMNIFVGYIYDALLCVPENESVVKTIMNKVVKQFNVNTHV